MGFLVSNIELKNEQLFKLSIVLGSGRPCHQSYYGTMVKIQNNAELTHSVVG